MRTVLEDRTRAGLSAGPPYGRRNWSRPIPATCTRSGASASTSPPAAFGLLGPNGAGKTTTIGMLNTAVVPTSGRALLAGHDVARDPNGARAISSVVFQDAVVDHPLTGRQNLELHMRLWGVRPAEGRPRLAELTKTVGIDDILDRPVATYSGGQRRRTEIVRALLRRPGCSSSMSPPRSGHPDPPRPLRRDRHPAGSNRGDHHHDHPLPRRGGAPVRPVGGDRCREHGRM